jgi:hypothetical protein
MQKTLLSLIFVCLSFWSVAQLSVSINPGAVEASGSVKSPDIAAYCHITNNSSVPVGLLWSRSVVSKPAEWQHWVCDMTLCYLPHVDHCPSGNPNYLDPGQSFELSYHVKPLGVEGVGHFKLYVYDLSDTEVMLDSVEFTFNTTTTSVSDVTSSGVRIYPNPTTSYFQLQEPTGVARVIVYNIVGSKMREFDARNSNRFDVSDLSEGIYLVRLLDAKQAVLKTVRLSKR